ncbi:hypothetical protein LINPERHAP1_LOCUS31045 [Linum perenne]
MSSLKRLRCTNISLGRKKYLFEAFQYFYKDISWYITRDELIHAMSEYVMADEATIDTVDTDKVNIA